MATKFAVLTALRNVFIHSDVSEWFEYGGTHHRFRILLDVRESPLGVDLAEIRRSLITFNRLTAHLDAIILHFAVDKTPIVTAGITKHAVTHLTHPSDRNISQQHAIDATKIVTAGKILHMVKHTAIPQ